ncbi:MAG: AAA family ATPase [Bacilli bacterium]|nr:AAA family ATPase [Bacilli bacterium]
MNNRQILEDVYKDFFPEKATVIEEKPEEVLDEEFSVDTLFISDESKELLNKIIRYMEDYSKGIENNYLTFNITIESNDKNIIDSICDLIRYYSNKYNYVDKKSMTNVSLYKLDKCEELADYYKENGIVVYSNIDALGMQDVMYHKKFFYNLFELSKDKTISIITGKKDVLKSFMLEDANLKNTFCFSIIGTSPSINDVYNEVLAKTNVNEELNIKVLDYITESFPKTEESYSTYVDNLCKYISFNKDVPKLDEVKSVDLVFKELDELVGLEKVKKSLHDLVDLITLKNKTKDDLKINNVNLHMVFLGNPGTGKTTVARMVSSILYDLKYIKQNKLIEVSSKDLVAEYVGQTAVKTMNVIEKAMGGILFVDEAYALADKNGENSYNGEAIATLIKAMEDYRDELVVIFAGYTKEMQAFLDSNSGIVSRIGYTLEFDDYTNEELIEIFKGMVTKAGFLLDSECIPVVEDLINKNRDTKNFGNARFIRNMYEKSVIKHATNTKNNKSKKILKTITKKDITL